MNQPAGRKFLPLVEEGKGVCKANQVFSDPYWSSSEPEHLSQQISPLLFDLCHLSKQSTLEYPGSHWQHSMIPLPCIAFDVPIICRSPFPYHVVNTMHSQTFRLKLMNTNSCPLQPYPLRFHPSSQGRWKVLFDKYVRSGLTDQHWQTTPRPGIQHLDELVVTEHDLPADLLPVFYLLSLPADQGTWL